MRRWVQDLAVDRVQSLLYTLYQLSTDQQPFLSLPITATSSSRLLQLPSPSAPSQVPEKETLVKEESEKVGENQPSQLTLAQEQPKLTAEEQKKRDVQESVNLQAKSQADQQVESRVETKVHFEEMRSIPQSVATTPEPPSLSLPLPLPSETPAVQQVGKAVPGDGSNGEVSTQLQALPLPSPSPATRRSMLMRRCAPFSAPSASFLSPDGRSLETCTPLSDRGTAFLGATTGFIPGDPLPPLPPSHAEWDAAAARLPAVVRSGEWAYFASTFPSLDADALPDAHLLRANACLGAVAHAVRNVGNLALPPSIMRPWRRVTNRLSRPTPAFNSLDWFIYNFDLIPQRFAQRVVAQHPHERMGASELGAGGDGRGGVGFWGSANNHNNTSEFGNMKASGIESPWQQTRPRVTVTGSMTEAHFITGCFAIEHSAASLPGLVAATQEAATCDDDEAVHDGLAAITRVIEEMTNAFRSADPRPLSATYVDPVEWGRCIGVVGLPVVPGEKTISGLLFPSIHLLDVFFSRRDYDTEMGRLESTDRRWLPPLHREFLKTVAKVSVLDYITKRSTEADALMETPGIKKTNRKHLLYVFRRALSAFTGEEGFLGKHRLRIAGFLELSMKVGRPMTAAGTETSGWQHRAWRGIDMAMRDGMRERQALCADRVYKATVSSCAALHADSPDVHQLVLDTGGALIYSPGDHIALLPENDRKLVDETLDALGLQPSTKIAVTDAIWLHVLSNYGHDIDTDLEVDIQTPIYVNAEDFLKVAALQPLDYELGCRLADALYVINPAVISYLRHERATNVPIALRMIRETGSISSSHLLASLDVILRPLPPRYYSVASHMAFAPEAVELIVGAVRYVAQEKLSFKYGHIPWRTGSGLTERAILMPGLAEDHLALFVKNTVQHGERPPNNKEAGVKDITSRFAKMPLNDKVARICDLLRSDLKASGPRLTGKAKFRAQVLTYDAQCDGDQRIRLQGVSSSYISRLKPGDAVRAFVVPELDFRMPTGNAPIVMISLGTGMAPFRAFMKELIREKHAYGTVRRTAWLILGVQSRDRIPFIDDIEEAVCRMGVVRLSMAFSQEDVELDPTAEGAHLAFRPGKRKRIHGLFEDDARLACDLWTLLTHGGHIFACGRPELEPLARDLVVFAVKRFANTLWSSTFFDANYDLARLADEYADRLAADRRLHIDAYHSGRPIAPNVRYTLSDVARHRQIEDCWSIFRGGVYDITRYLSVHPGGPKLLFDKAGRDMSTDFDVAHGANNHRIAGMLAPYRVGDVERFFKGSDRLKRFMATWSAPLLHAVLEHRSVFLLDVNRFPSLREPPSFVVFKSQIDAPEGLSGLCDKFWVQYEPDLFQLFMTYAGKSCLGAAIQTLAINPGAPDCDMVQEALTQRRGNTHRGTKADGGTAEERIRRYYRFIEEMVDTCVAVQQAIERIVVQPLSKHAFEDLCTVMMSDVLRALCDGVTNSYSILAGDQRQEEW